MKAQSFIDLAARLFDVAGDMKKSITFSSVTIGAYDPITDTNTETTVDLTFKAVVTNYNSSEVGEGIKQTDYKAKLLAVDVVTLAKIPELNDVVVVDTVNHTILNIQVDPAGAVYTMQLRA